MKKPETKTKEETYWTTASSKAGDTFYLGINDKIIGEFFVNAEFEDVVEARLTSIWTRKDGKKIDYQDLPPAAIQ